MPQERGLHGEDTARLIDAEIKRILTDAHDKARTILTSHRDKLETVTRRLLEIEVMEGDELRRLLGLPPSAHDVTEAKTPLPPIDSPAAPPVA
jgi:cell division protease FtsH